MQGLVPDPTLLDTSEVELVDLKFLEEEPIVVAQFTCQQINCTRDSFGNVVDGRPDEVQRWAGGWAGGGRAGWVAGWLAGWLAGWVGGWLGLAGSGWLAGLGWPAGRPARRVAHSAALLPPRCLSWRPSPLDLPPACVRLCHSTACCRVYYYWALQQERQGFVGEDGAYHPPRWQLREMLIRGMHHLL